VAKHKNTAFFGVNRLLSKISGYSPLLAALESKKSALWKVRDPGPKTAVKYESMAKLYHEEQAKGKGKRTRVLN
jgi:hypothetical protein